MEQQLTRKDLELILESLEYTKRKFQEYTDYPSYGFKQQQVQRVDAVRDKLRALRDSLSK